MKPAPQKSEAPLDGSRFVVEVFSELDQQTVMQRWREINVLLRLSMLTGLQMQLDATLNLLCDYSQEIVGYDSALVYFWSEKEDRYSLRIARNFSETALNKFSSSNIFSFWSAKYSQPLVLHRGDNPSADAFLHGIGAESSLVVPLFMNNRVMGSLQLFNSAHDAFTKEDAQLLWILSLVSENLLTRESTNEGLLRFAFTDYLTGLRSRGYFEQQLELEIKRAERKRASFALMMLDIDHFKLFNDTFGHHVGDQVLKDVSALLVRDMREVDTVARYGGEEFVIILPETTLHGALQVADRLRHSVEQAKFFAGQPASQQRLTISIGIAMYAHDGQHRNELIEAADSALYQAKERGRNRVVSYSETAHQHQTG